MLCYRCGSHVPETNDTCPTCGMKYDATARQAAGVARKRGLEGAPYKPGDVLAGRYSIKEVVGSGPMGFVFRAQDEEIDVEVALKTVHPRLVQQPEERTQFSFSMRVGKKLNHPNLLRVYEEGLDGERPFFTMQLLEGLTLRRMMEQRASRGQLFSLKDVEPLLAQMAAALDAAHRFGPHSDVKPENVIVLPDLLKVTDYGLGLAVPQLPFVQAQKGHRSDVYIAPEYVAGGELDTRMDVYSLGVVMGELLTGLVPTEGVVPGLTSLHPDLPTSFEALYRRALNINPLARPKSAGELHAEFANILARSPAAVTTRVRGVPPPPGSAQAAAVRMSARPPPPVPTDMMPIPTGIVSAAKPPPPVAAPHEEEEPPPPDATQPLDAATLAAIIGANPHASHQRLTEQAMPFISGPAARAAMESAQGGRASSDAGRGGGESPYGGRSAQDAAHGGRAGAEGGRSASESLHGGRSSGESSQSGRGGGESSQSGRGGGESLQSGRGGGESSQSGRGGGESSQGGRGGGESSQSGRGSGESSQGGRGGGESSQSGRGGGESSQSGRGGAEASQSGRGVGGSSQGGRSGGESSQSGRSGGESSQGGRSGSESAHGGRAGAEASQSGRGSGEPSQGGRGGGDPSRSGADSNHSGRSGAESLSRGSSEPSLSGRSSAEPSARSGGPAPRASGPMPSAQPRASSRGQDSVAGEAAPSVSGARSARGLESSPATSGARPVSRTLEAPVVPSIRTARTLETVPAMSGARTAPRALDFDPSMSGARSGARIAPTQRGNRPQKSSAKRRRLAFVWMVVLTVGGLALGAGGGYLLLNYWKSRGTPKPSAPSAGSVSRQGGNEVAPPLVVALSEKCQDGMRLVSGGSFKRGKVRDDELAKVDERPSENVMVNSFCIDEFEFPNQRGATPRVDVTLAQARALCEAAQKRLCTEDEWEKACKGPGNARFAYGNDYLQGTCNTKIPQAGIVPSIAASGTSPQCVSPGYRVADLSGNVAEWTETRIERRGTIQKGGAFNEPYADSRCSAVKYGDPEMASASVGFRCCSSAQP
ncbi:protein kinase [Myxococcus stipitatus DSM 14675]|uniref:Protein kinase n=1 Tax=Myxococcus stipitatus (strain DSM 14675 / JCM 12634 / Mx s8) TaxID=1278073 RepID=L7U6D8_MYXSD|nr:protein kinase [Myxococcus stipitatus]AGC43688.1 protein kinase [Myxococcus stipitatus DSM 14675]